MQYYKLILLILILIFNTGCKQDFSTNVELQKNLERELVNRINALPQAYPQDKILVSFLKYSTNRDSAEIMLCIYDKFALTQSDTDFWGAINLKGYEVLFYGDTINELVTIKNKKKYRSKLFSYIKMPPEYDPKCNFFYLRIK
jgi:hypothetical protein